MKDIWKLSAIIKGCSVPFEKTLKFSENSSNFFKKVLKFFTKTMVFLGKLLVFKKNVLVFLEVHANVHVKHAPWRGRFCVKWTLSVSFHTETLINKRIQYMQCVKATFINFLLKPKQLFGLPQVFKLNRPPEPFSNWAPTTIKKRKFLSNFLFYRGGRWDSNPRHSEPQSDALTNWTTATVLAFLSKAMQR